MKIYISKRHRFVIYLWLPTAFVKSKWLWKRILSQAENVDCKEILALLPHLSKGLKSYISKHGHFDLVNVHSSDGVKVHIRI